MEAMVTVPDEAGRLVSSAGEMDATAPALDEVAAVREALVRAYDDCVPELVGGATVQEVIASVEVARAAYAEVAARVVRARGETAPVVPAGGGRAVADVDALPAAEKVRRGIAGRSGVRG
jgi:hypothetical protein